MPGFLFELSPEIFPYGNGTGPSWRKFLIHYVHKNLAAPARPFLH